MAPPAATEAAPLPQTKSANGDETTDRVKANELKENKIADRLGAADTYIDGEKDTCWYHWTGSIYVKPLRFENRSGTYVIVLKTDPHAELGKHRHRGEVRAYVSRPGVVIFKGFRKLTAAECARSMGVS